MRAIDADELITAVSTWQKFGVDERNRLVPWNEDLVPYIHLRDAITAICGMPTIEPERKKGKWIKRKNVVLGDCIECSLCENRESRIAPGWWNSKNYCPNCGAKMIGVFESG